MVFSLSNLSVYGSAIIYNFGFLTNPVVGSHDYCENGILNLDEGHKDFIKGLSVTSPQMNCWSQESLAFMAQFYFIGFASKIFIEFFPENHGYVRVTKFAILPLNIVAFQLQLFSQSYLLRCVGFFLQGLCYIKVITCYIILKDICLSKFDSLMSILTIARDYSVIGVFCLSMVIISRDAIFYLYVVNVLNIISFVIFAIISVESPSYLISKGKHQESIKCLNYISKFNNFFKKSAY